MSKRRIKQIIKAVCVSLVSLFILATTDAGVAAAAIAAAAASPIILQ
jgi:hypothetical protein